MNKWNLAGWFSFEYFFKENKLSTNFTHFLKITMCPDFMLLYRSWSMMFYQLMTFLLCRCIHLSTIFSRDLSLALFPFFVPVGMMFSSSLPMYVYCFFKVDLLRFLSSLAFVKHFLFVISPVICTLNILLRNHISAASNDL